MEDKVFPFFTTNSIDCDVIISDRSVSRVHARMKQIEGILHFIDENSKFGTFVQREKVENTWTPIKDDVIDIKLGAYNLNFRIEKFPFMPFYEKSNNTNVYADSLQNATHLICSSDGLKNLCKEAKLLGIPILKETVISSFSSPEPISSLADWISSFVLESTDFADEVDNSSVHCEDSPIIAKASNSDTEDEILPQLKTSTIFLSDSNFKNPTGTIQTIQPIGKKFKKSFQRKRLPETIPLSSLKSNLYKKRAESIKSPTVVIEDQKIQGPPSPQPQPYEPPKAKFKSALFKTL